MKKVSIIIPVHNEELYISEQVGKLVAQLQRLALEGTFELLLVENGSTDSTGKLIDSLAKTYPIIRAIHLAEPSYGQAVKTGLLQAKGEVVVQFDLDFWDINFLRQALKKINDYDIVIGSKNLEQSHDDRPLSRKITSNIIGFLLKARFGLSISDTHGLKVMKKQAIAQVIAKTRCTNHFFDTEMIIRAVRKNVAITELPVSIRELRDTRFSFMKRLMQVVPELVILFMLPLGIISISHHKRPQTIIRFNNYEHSSLS